MTSSNSPSIVLANGTALIHDANNRVVPTQTSILIKDGKIARIAKNIEVEDGVEVIDCTDKIISPGLVDTHHHGWQTQLKGRHANQLLMEYMVTGNALSFLYSAKDIFYGQLAGMLETLSAGTTTVVDHAHMTISPDHARLGIAATASSGIRSVFCYVPIMRVKHFNPLTYHPNPMEDWVMQTFSELAKQGPWGQGRVTLGFGFDFWFLPTPFVKGIFAQVKEAGVKTFTTHSVSIPQMGGGWPGGLPQMLTDLDLLDERVILSHGNGYEKKDVDLIRAAGAHVSSTPSTEFQMAMGRSVVFDASFVDGGANGKAVGVQDHASFGIDCHSNQAGSIVTEARIGLQNARNHYNEHFLRQGKMTHSLPESLSVEAAFNLATIKGAEAVRMEKEIGRIEVGFKADLIVFDALSPGMVGAAQHDPVAAIILHSSPADIEIVIVDGIVRKRDGKLVTVEVDQGAREAVGRDKLEWKGIAEEIVRSRAGIQRAAEKHDNEEGLRTIKTIFHIDESLYVDGV
ncbi:Metallo-dependent hydrolase [Melanomma pulvis-pyrius CBS 109.77]|uniref:Metallo-dependent hydrolase n=1 Tax=Melanomma pulvis-pyrius CBS 109.77 TaxID=1314802 RepID=A0A6A6X6E9_9PLEO|nr:Metallo-dependent hydrolase [Melanomma pulvis-pyrius CBS 109.77]